MRQFGEILGLSVGLQEIEEEVERAKTILEFLRERMEGDDRMERRKTLAERLGLKGMGCCGGIRASTISNMDEEVEDNNYESESGPVVVLVQSSSPSQEETEVVESGRVPQVDNSDPDCGPVVSGMNLADALAAERQFRGLNDEDGRMENEAETPVRMSLMRLLEEGDDEEERGRGNDTVCCVCMGKKKGSAFIPCGHTFCRVCSRELWLNRGSCPLCNRQIIDILDIF